MKRLFIGVPLPEEIQRNVLPVVEELRQSGADLKMVAPENLHFTVKFLGDVEEGKVEGIIKVLENTLQSIAPFVLRLKGIGAFPSLERINSLWVAAPSREFTNLMSTVEQALAFVRKDQHPEEVPHATLARVKSGKNKEKLRELLAKHATTEFGEMGVEKVVLYESELRKEGPVYWVVKEFTLK